MSRFRSPWQFSSSDIENLCYMTKTQFFDFVEMVQGVHTRRWSSGLNVFAASLLFLLKTTKNLSFSMLSTIFALRDRTNASQIFRRVLIFFYKNCINLQQYMILMGI